MDTVGQPSPLDLQLPRSEAALTRSSVYLVDGSLPLRYLIRGVSSRTFCPNDHVSSSIVVFDIYYNYTFQ